MFHLTYMKPVLEIYGENVFHAHPLVARCGSLCSPHSTMFQPAAVSLFPSNLHVFPQWPLEAEASQFFLQSSVNIHV